MGSDGTSGTLEVEVEPGRREASTEETAYAGSLATSEAVEKVRQARSEKRPMPLYLQGMLAEYAVKRRVETV